MTPPHVRTAHEVTVARERAQRTARCVLHLLLRRGVCGYIELARTLRARGDTVDRLRGAVTAATTATTTATATATATTAAATTATATSATAASRARRVNPEDVKAALHHCGVLLRSESHRVLLHAYSDSVGFVLADDLLRALAPLTHVSPSLQQCLWRHLAPWVLVQQHHDDNDDGGDDDTDGYSDDATRTCATAATTATVTLASARATLAHLFADTTTPRATTADTNDDDDSRAAVAVVMQRAQEQAQRCFAHDAYAGDRVPVVDVLDFVAAHALLLFPSSSSMLCDGAASLCDDSATTAAAPCTLTTSSSSLSLQRLLRARAACAPALTPCCSDSSSDNSNSKDVLHTTTSSATAVGTADATQQQQHPCASDDATHTFARYRDNVDRRDEWLRGCDAYTARPTYQTHVVGYAGHLPEYTRRFGRTFHVIEESLPHLGKLQQQEQQQQPQGVTAHDDKAAPDVDGAHVGDGSDTRIELKYSRMNKHHFTFA